MIWWLESLATKIIQNTFSTKSHGQGWSTSQCLLQWSLRLDSGKCFGKEDGLLKLCANSGRNSYQQPIPSKLPSGYVKIAIENDHWSSGFSHWKWWFSIVFCMFTRGYQLLLENHPKHPILDQQDHGQSMAHNGSHWAHHLLRHRHAGCCISGLGHCLTSGDTVGGFVNTHWGVLTNKHVPGWWFQPLWKILVNGKDYPIYYGE